MKTIQIIGVSPSASSVPSDPGGAERWCFNNPRMYKMRCPQALSTWTRWFNLHSMAHMMRTYPGGVKWYSEQQKPIYLQQRHPHIPASQPFPHDSIPSTYFTCSLAWLLALAIGEAPKRIELWGFSGDANYAAQKPCVAYWVQWAQRSAIEVWGQEGLDFGPAGDPASYTGPLYGYETT